MKGNRTCDLRHQLLSSVDKDLLWAGRPRGRSSSPGRVKNFHFSISSRPALGTQPAIQWVQAALSPGLNRQGREADHSSPTSAEIKKIRIYTFTPHTSLRLNYAQEQLYLYNTI
jgi:hypothetical protein